MLRIALAVYTSLVEDTCHNRATASIAILCRRPTNPPRVNNHSCTPPSPEPEDVLELQRLDLVLAVGDIDQPNLVLLPQPPERLQ